MKNDNNDILRLSPARGYNPPNLPSLEDARNNPELLKALPSRWKKSAAAMACLGFAGMLVLSSCVPEEPFHHGGAGGEPFYVACPTETDPWLHHGGDGGGMPFYVACITESEAFAYMRSQMEAADLALTVHHGGDGGAPVYVAHFTEHDVREFIRAKLESVGLNFDASPTQLIPDTDINSRYTPVSSPYIQGPIVDLLDSDHNVAIVLRTQSGLGHFEMLYTPISVEDAAEAMGITLGIIYNPAEVVGRGVPAWDNNEEPVEATPERKEEARPLLIESLTLQIEDFIHLLRISGVIS